MHLNAQGLKAVWTVAPISNIDAGVAYTASLKVTNTGKETATVVTDVSLPNNWLNLSTASKPIEVQPNKSTIILITYRAPNSALSRAYAFNVKVTDGEGNLVKRFKNKLNIRKGFKVRVENLTKRTFVTSDEEFSNSYQIINNSNVPVELELKGKNANLTQEDTLYLKPGESKTVDIQVKAPQSFSKVRNHVYGLKLECEAFDTVTTQLNNIEVFPDVKYQDDPYQRFPVQLSLNYLARETSGEYIQAFQGELYAKGTLNEDKNDKLEIRLKGPDRVQYSLFGNFAEYFARYTSDNFNIWVGDQTLNVTNLTERGRFVRGVNTSLKMKRFVLHGFYGRSRFFPDLTDEYGSKLEFVANDKFTVGAATLVKNFNAPDSSAIVPTFFTNYTSQKFNFSSEVAYGTTGEKEGYAVDVSASTTLGKFKVAARALNADLYFPGFLRNSQIGSLNANYRFDKIQIGIISNYRNSNPSLDTFFVAAPISYNALANINYRFNDISVLEFRAGQTRRTDRFEPKRFDYTEFINRISFRQNFEAWDYEAYTEYGRNNNFLLPEGNSITASYTAGVSGSVKFGENFRASINTIYLNTNRYAIERISNFVAGGRLFWRYGVNSRISLAYRSSYEFEDIYETQDQFEFLWSQSIARNHNVSVTARYAKPRLQLEGRSLFITANYTYRFNMPLKKKKNQGKIRGRLFTSDSTGIQGARLKITSSKAVSDEDGLFIFSRLSYGTYYLSIDRSSMGINQITEQPLPIKVEVTEANPIPDLNIKVVEAGHIKGSIMYPKIKNELLDNKSKKFRPVYIEINSGKERHIVPCDTLGNFSFDYIRPGKWKLRLIESTLDDNFIYNKTKTTIEIKAGESRSVNFKARRKQKQLRMVSPPIRLTAKSHDKTKGGTK